MDKEGKMRKIHSYKFNMNEVCPDFDIAVDSLPMSMPWACIIDKYF